MNKQKEREDKDIQRLVNNYEHNLGLLLDALKTELGDVNKDKSLQFNNFKTVMWLNIVFVGISIKILEYQPNIWVYLLFIIPSAFSVLFSLVGMIEGKHNAYTSVGRPKRIASIPNDEWAKSQGYLTVIYSYRRAIKYNGINLIRRSKWIRRSKITSLIAFLFLIILSLSAIHFNKESMMAKPTQPPVQPIVKPVETGKRTNEAKNIGVQIRTKDSNGSKK